MKIEGYVFKQKEQEIREKYKKRYEEIKHHIATLDLKRTPAYGKGEFHGVLKTGEEKSLNELDLALIADRGNLCFGGYCTKRGNSFSGAYWTD